MPCHEYAILMIRGVNMGEQAYQKNFERGVLAGNKPVPL